MSAFPLSSEEIGERRLIEFISIKAGKGEIWVAGKIQRIVFDDLVDLVQAVEMIMLKTTGKVLNPSLRPAIANRKALQFDTLIAGDSSLYDADDSPAEPGAWYMLVKIDGSRWDNWFTRLDEMIKMLYIIVREAQGDPYKPPLSFYVPRSLGHA